VRSKAFDSCLHPEFKVANGVSPDWAMEKTANGCTSTVVSQKKSYW
jgi:hypothetical protein